MIHTQVGDQITLEVARLTSLPLISKIFNRLSAELPKNLTYHTPAHAREVVVEAISFGVTDGISARDLELLAIGAAFHDAGFLVREENNEILGAEMAEKAMREEGGYSEEEIRLVREMIMDTSMTGGAFPGAQRATNFLSRYLLDADLSNFGREDFFEKLSLVEQELGKSHREHLEQTFALFTRHSWCTPAAESLRSAQKERNKKKLEKLLR